MKNIIDNMGETIAELIGLSFVVVGLVGAIAVLRTFGNNFIEFFL